MQIIKWECEAAALCPEQGLKFLWNKCESLTDQLLCPGSDVVTSKWGTTLLRWQQSCLFCFLLWEVQVLHHRVFVWSVCLTWNGTFRFNEKSSWEEVQTCKPSLGKRSTEESFEQLPFWLQLFHRVQHCFCLIHIAVNPRWHVCRLCHVLIDEKQNDLEFLKSKLFAVYLKILGYPFMYKSVLFICWGPYHEISNGHNPWS